MDADMDLTDTSSAVNVTNGLTLNGTASLGNNASMLFSGSGEQLLDGDGTIRFLSTFSQVYNFGGTVLRIGPDITIHGTVGNVGGNQSATGMINQGTIDSDEIGTLTVGTPAGSWTNQGMVRASNGGTATIVGQWTNQGTLAVDGTSVLNLAGTFNECCQDGKIN
jgi:hypothetical protein